MESELPIAKIMAFVAEAKSQHPKPGRSVEGYVMFVNQYKNGSLEQEIEYSSRGLDDFLGLDQKLDLSETYPAFMIWEGEVTWSEYDVFVGNGQWRRAKASEIIAASEGKNPFSLLVSQVIQYQSLLPRTQ